MTEQKHPNCPNCGDKMNPSSGMISGENSHTTDWACYDCNERIEDIEMISALPSSYSGEYFYSERYIYKGNETICKLYGTDKEAVTTGVSIVKYLNKTK